MTSFIKKNNTAIDEFIVNDTDGSLVTGLINASFSKYLYNPSGIEISDSIPVTVAELGNGVYRVTFTPNVIGAWNILIVHATYFPYGIGGSYLCVENLFDDIKTDTDSIVSSLATIVSDIWNYVSRTLTTGALTVEQDERLKLILGLSQQNYRIFNPTYVLKNGQQCMTSAIIKTYPTATDCNNDTNVLAEYQITAAFDNTSRMTGYKVVKV